MLVTNSVRSYSIPFNFLLETYKIPETELLYILIAGRNIKYEYDSDKANKIFFLNDNDLDYLAEINKFKADIKKYQEINKSLLVFLYKCRGYQIKNKPLIILQEFNDYTEYLTKHWTPFYSKLSDDLLINNYKKTIKQHEDKIKELENIIKESKDKIKKLEDKMTQTENCNKYKKECEELKNQIISFKLEVKKPANFWHILKNFFMR